MFAISTVYAGCKLCNLFTMYTLRALAVLCGVGSQLPTFRSVSTRDALRVLCDARCRTCDGDAGCGMWDVECERRAAGCGLRVVGRGLQTKRCGLRAAGCRLRAAGCGCGLRT
eukprot:11171095-Lingulodinium_polyedra.AAC.1